MILRNIKYVNVGLFLVMLLFFAAFHQGNNKDVIKRKKSEEKIQVMILGVYHFSNPGKDKYNLSVDDYFNNKRQDEINEVNELLADFDPNKIFIEQMPERQDTIDSLYQSYVNNELKLKHLKNGRNEIYQIGFKLAKKLDLKKLYCVVRTVCGFYCRYIIISLL